MSQTQVEHSDSISSQDPHGKDVKKTKSRRPANTAFRQQRLKAWQPILTPKTVLPLFFVVGIIFAPIGGLLLYASSQVQELSIDYTSCETAPTVSNITDSDNVGKETRTIPSDRVSSSFKSPMTIQPKWGWSKEENQNFTFPSGHSRATPVCILEFSIPNDINPPVLFYYRLTNFYQNHRRYVKSLDTDQLKGKVKTPAEIRSGDCDPLDVGPDEKVYYPCGLIANSMFNDTYETLSGLNIGGNAATPYDMSTTGIAWDSEKDLYKKTGYNAEQILPPPNWQNRYPDGKYTNNDMIPDIHTDESFQVWMRTAGLPTFSKLAKRNDNEVLKAGTYRLQIWDNFRVEKYGGTKAILLSTRTVMGGKNPFLGIAYIVVGGLCILLGAVFTATHLIKPRKLGDHTYLSWNNDQPSTATATGRARPGDTA